MGNYANAKDVLPKELFEELKKYCTGGMLYISEGAHHRDKQKLAVMLHGQKTDIRDIANITGLSTRRVYQIIAQERQKNAVSGCANK
ncbi:MAG: hypothetical protein A2017_09965 [Lentisphaerae bacterium GWF2_44_16]|nr:MAG: hypothetical protein A2017_09965 [Lentisphaerae bacterium GWF2_44_16]